MVSIALDGPAGAGKSTLARAAAEKLGYIYVDTGALYRAVGLKFSREGHGTELDCDIEKILEDTSVDIRFIGKEQHVFLDGEDVNSLIRTPEISMMASAVMQMTGTFSFGESFIVRSRWSTSVPSIPGIRWSMTTTS